MISSIAGLTVVLAFAFVLNSRLKVNSSLTPLLSVTVLINIALLFAMLGQLKGGVIFVYLMSLALLGWEIWRNKKDLAEKLQDFFTPGVTLFALSSVVMLWILYSTQPVFHGWDEFSFWGTAQKVIFKFDALYTYHNTSMLGQSIPPALPVLSYFFGFLNGALVEWVSYYAYDVLFLACFSAFTAPFGKKQAHLAFTTFATGFIIPFIFEITDISSRLYSTYISTYADIPMALLFAGAVAMYFFNEDSHQRILCSLPVILFLTFTKDMGFALSCIVVFVTFFDMWVGRKEFTFLKLKGFFAKCLAAATMLATTLISFVGWSVHLSKVLKVSRSDFSDKGSVGMAEMLIRGVSELFGEKSDKFRVIYDRMIAAFPNTKVSMLGSGLTVVAVITVIFVIAFILSDKNGRIRTATMYTTMWIGFIGYYVFHLFLYVFIFQDDAYSLPSYDRYMYLYYIGWLLMGLMCLAKASLAGIKKPARAVLLAVCVALAVMFNFCADMGNTFMGANSTHFHKRQLIQQKADYLKDAIGEDDVIYVASRDNGGEHWFIYTYELLDNFICRDYFIWWEADTDEGRDAVAHKVMAEYYKKNKVTHLLIDNVDNEYVRRYSHCFDVSISDIGLDSVAYFKLSFTEDGSFRGTLVKGGSIND